MDEELGALERRAHSTDDPSLRVRLATAFVRCGALTEAARQLALVGARAPTGEVVRALVDAGIPDEALAVLDPLLRGGVDPDAPWPCSGGDLWRTGRSIAAGPRHGRILERRALPVRVDRAASFAVDARGRMLARVANEKELAWLHGDSSEPSGLPAGGPMLLAWGPASRWMADVKWGRESRTSVRRPSGKLACFEGECELTPGRAFLTPDGHIYAREPSMGALRWTHDCTFLLEGTAYALPGPHVLWETAGYNDAYSNNEDWVPANFSRHDAITGKSLSGTSRDGVYPFAAPDGTIFYVSKEGLAAEGPDGRVLFGMTAAGPFVLAGELDELVVVGSASAHSARDGSLRWERSAARPLLDAKVDGTGVVWGRRGDELVSIEPTTGKVIRRVSLAGPSGRPRKTGKAWSFAFAGEARIHVLRDDGDGTELIVVE